VIRSCVYCSMASISNMPSASIISNVSSSGNLVQVSSTTSMATSVADSNLCGEGPLGQALQVVEKKVRNLEKRKGKLDGYRAEIQRGKTLNEDQKAAIAKYDEVLQTLEFARELSAQFKTLAVDEEKTRKKQIKKELQERNKVEIERIASTIEIQDLLKCVSTVKSKADFTSGENGAAPKLSKEQIGHLEDFGRLLRPSRRQHETAEEFEKALGISSEHILSLIEGKSKKVGKTTYKDLLNTLDGIRASGYFDGKNASKNTEISEGTDEVTTETSKKDASDGITVSKDANRKKVSQNGQEQEKREGGRRDKKRGSVREERSNDKGSSDQKVNDQSKQRQQYEKPMPPQNLPEHHSQALQQQNDVYQSVTSQQTNVIVESSHQPIPMAVDSIQSNLSQQYHQATLQAPQQMAVAAPPTAPGINFLQESQIDTESPLMDPAVMVVHHTAPPTQGQNALQQGNQQPPHITTAVQNQVHLLHQQATLQQPGGIATTISGFTNQNGAVNTIAFMPQTALAMQQQQHVAYAQAPFQPQQQQIVVPSHTQQLQAQQQHVPSHQQQTPIEEPSKQENLEPKQHHDDSQRINTGHGDPSASVAKPQGYAAAAASTNGTPSYSKQVQQNSETLQDTMSKIDDWNAEDAGYANSEARGDNRNGFRNGNGRGGYRGGRGGDRGGRTNQNGDRGGYRGGNSGYRGPDRGERSNGRGEYGTRRGGSGRGGGSGERSERGSRGQDRPAVRGDRGKDFRGEDKGPSARGRGEGGRGRAAGNTMSNGFSEQKVN